MTEKTEKLDKLRYLKRTIIVCWVILFASFFAKIIFGDLFLIACDLPRLKAICDYADNNLWADFLIAFAYCFINMYFLTLAMIGQKRLTFNQFLIYAFTILVGTGIKIFNSSYGVFFDIWQCVIMPVIFVWNNKKRFIYIILGNVLLVLFQAVSLFTKSLGLEIVTKEGYFISIIYSLDVSIMILLYYFYMVLRLKRKETN